MFLQQPRICRQLPVQRNNSIWSPHHWMPLNLQQKTWHLTDSLTPQMDPPRHLFNSILWVERSTDWIENCKALTGKLSYTPWVQVKCIAISFMPVAAPHRSVYREGSDVRRRSTIASPSIRRILMRRQSKFNEQSASSPSDAKELKLNAEVREIEKKPCKNLTKINLQRRNKRQYPLSSRKANTLSQMPESTVTLT